MTIFKYTGLLWLILFATPLSGQKGSLTLMLDSISPFVSSEKVIKGYAFRTDTISKSLYTKQKLRSKSMVIKDSSKVIWTDSSFTLRLQKAEMRFKCDKQTYSYCNYYLGYIKVLQLYAVSEVDAENETGTLLMVDCVSGKTFQLQSPYDFPLADPSVSPDTALLCARAYDYYSGENYIAFYRIRRTGAKFQLQIMEGLKITGQDITEMFWMGKNQLFLKTEEQSEVEKRAKPAYLKLNLRKL